MFDQFVAQGLKIEMQLFQKTLPREKMFPSSLNIPIGVPQLHGIKNGNPNYTVNATPNARAASTPAQKRFLRLVKH